MIDERPTTDDRRPTTGTRHRFRRASRPWWLRAALLLVAASALAVAGAAIGRGFDSGARVVSQAVIPTAASQPTAQSTSPTSALAALATAQPAGITPAPAAQATAAPSSAPLATVAPTAIRPAAEPGWPALAEERFDGPSASWPETRAPGWRASYRDGGYELRLVDRPSISYSRPLRAHDFWLGADVRIGSGQAGLFLLLGRPNDFYRFLIDDTGRYRLEWQQVGAARPLIDWTASDALGRGAGATNRIAARRMGDTLALYANGELLATYALPPDSMLEARVGLALDAPAGRRDGAALFDNLVARAAVTFSGGSGQEADNADTTPLPAHQG